MDIVQRAVLPDTQARIAKQVGGSSRYEMKLRIVKVISGETDH